MQSYVFQELALGWAGVQQVVVTDLNQERLDYAAKMCPPEKAKEKGVDLRYVNTSGEEDPEKALIALSQLEELGKTFSQIKKRPLGDTS